MIRGHGDGYVRYVKREGGVYAFRTYVEEWSGETWHVDIDDRYCMYVCISYACMYVGMQVPAEWSGAGMYVNVEEWRWVYEVDCLQCLPYVHARIFAIDDTDAHIPRLVNYYSMHTKLSKEIKVVTQHKSSQTRIQSQEQTSIYLHIYLPTYGINSDL